MQMTKQSMDAERSEYEAAHREMDEAEQHAGLGDMLRKGASAIGKKLLGDKTDADATGHGRDYKLYLEEMKANGETPMTREDFIKSRAPVVKA